jgi:hypothetical protein
MTARPFEHPTFDDAVAAALTLEQLGTAWSLRSVDHPDDPFCPHRSYLLEITDER